MSGRRVEVPDRLIKLIDTLCRSHEIGCGDVAGSGEKGHLHNLFLVRSLPSHHGAWSGRHRGSVVLRAVVVAISRRLA